MKKLKQLLKTCKRKAKILLGHTYKGQRNKPIIFILSTGRCGSTSIKDIFNQHPKFLAFHEVIEPLIYLSTQLAEQPERQKEIFNTLDTLFANRLWEAKRGQIIVHSDHRLWNLVPYLSNYFPNAYFIHLIRNPYDSVKSYLKRDWYGEIIFKDKRRSVFDKYRLQGNKIKSVSEEKWALYSQIDKSLWYWNYVNSHINNQLKTKSKDHWTHLTLEKLEDTLNLTIKSKFELEDEFRFISVIKNESNEEFDIQDKEDAIRNKIKEYSDELFLDYYPDYQ